MSPRMQYLCLFGFFLFFFFDQNVMAATAGMPWESRLDSLVNSITGPVARALGILAIVITGITMAFSGGGGVMQKVLWLIFGLSLAFSASSWALGFFGYGGGLTI